MNEIEIPFPNNMVQGEIKSIIWNKRIIFICGKLYRDLIDTDCSIKITSNNYPDRIFRVKFFDMNLYNKKSYKRIAQLNHYLDRDFLNLLAVNPKMFIVNDDTSKLLQFKLIH